MVEMNLGVVCGCLYSVQPVLALIFPRIFAKSYPSDDQPPPRTSRQPSNYPQSFEAYPLSDLSARPRDKLAGAADTFEALWISDGTGMNIASASSDGRKWGARSVPGAITVDREFTIQEEVTPCHSPMSEFGGNLYSITDLNSVDWELDDVSLEE